MVLAILGSKPTSQKCKNWFKPMIDVVAHEEHHHTIASCIWHCFLQLKYDYDATVGDN